MWLALAFISTCGVSADAGDAGDAGEAVLKATIAGCGVGTSIYSTLPCTVPSDTLYAHVVGMYLPELKNASISGEQLEGYAVTPISTPEQLLCKAAHQFRFCNRRNPILVSVFFPTRSFFLYCW